MTVNLLAAFKNWYGFIIGSGMVICIIIAYFMNKSRGYYKDLVFDVAIICIPLAIVGARFYYIFFDGLEKGFETWTFRRIIGLEDDGLRGLAIYGGLIGAVVGGIIVRALNRRKREEDQVTFIQMLDLFFCLIILGQAIGRWGNFANGEAYGNIVTNPKWQWFPYAVFIKDESLWHQATFFYESFWDLIGFGLLMYLYMGKRKSFDGFTFSIYCIWYGAGRAVIEGMRTDSLYLGPLRVSQWLSVVIVILGLVIIGVHVYNARKNGKKVFIHVDEELLSAEYYGYEKTILYKRRFFPDWIREHGGAAKEAEASLAEEETDSTPFLAEPATEKQDIDEDIDYAAKAEELLNEAPLEGEVPKTDKD